MKNQWINYLEEQIASLPESDSMNLLSKIASYAILLPFAPTISTDGAFERINETIVREGLNLMCYNAFVRSQKVNNFLDGEGFNN